MTSLDNVAVGRRGGGGNRRRLLSTPKDSNRLSKYLCIVRAQIEVFEATKEDVLVRTKKGGLRDPLALGSVGLRCIHCAHVPPNDQARGAVSYPKSIRIIYQAVRNWQRYHLPFCTYIPESVREEMAKAPKAERSRMKSEDFWMQSCRSIGMVDAKDGYGIQIASGLDAVIANHTVMVAASAAAKSPFVHSGFSSGDQDVRSGKNRDALLTSTSSPKKDSQDRNSPFEFGREIDCVSQDSENNLLQKFDAVERTENDTVEPFAVMSSNKITQEKDQTMPVKDGDPEPIEITAHGGKKLSAAFSLHSKDLNIQQKKILEKIEVALNVFPRLCNDGHSQSLERSNSDQLTENETERVLFSLGVKLYELFAEQHPFQEAHTDSQELSVSGLVIVDESPPKKKRDILLNNYNACVSLQHLGFPFSLSHLVANLLQGNNGGCRYSSLDEVRDELQLMSEKPQKFLFDRDLSELNDELVFPEDTLYGRGAQVEMLMSVYNRVIELGGPCEVVLASGYPGTGKTSLMNQVRYHIIQRGGYFMSGRFDELQQVQPLSAIVAAFNKYCDFLLSGNTDNFKRIRDAIKHALGTDANVLTNLIPRLSKIIGDNADSTQVAVEGMEAWNRLLFFFRKFICAISSSDHPVILFLDNLHWADKMSLELIRVLVTDKEITSFLLLGCFRDNKAHPDLLSMHLKIITDSNTQVTVINVQNIDRESVNSLVSDTLYLSRHLTRPLARIVFNKTSGNALFVVQFMKSLRNEGLLSFSMFSRRWEWDVETIESKNIADDVVQLMTNKMLKLAPEVLWALKMASCLSECNDLVMAPLGANNHLFANLDVCVSGGLMNKVGSTYKFSHDQIWRAAYSLLDAKERQSWHLLIGRSLRDQVLHDNRESILFVVVDQLQRGLEMISEHDEKVDFARLCLMAGEKAALKSTFLTASIHFLQGTALLKESDWEDNYDLCLQLFSCCAKALHTTGNHDGVTIALNSIFAHARCLQDEIPAHLTAIISLSAQGKMRDAIQYGLCILEKLGESFPNDIYQGIVEKEVAFTQTLLSLYSTDVILGTPLMQERSKLAVMDILELLLGYAAHEKQELTPCIVCRTIQLTHSHGLSIKSSMGFAYFAFILCQSVSGLEDGYRYGKLAIALTEHFETKRQMPQVYAIVYGTVNIFKEPIQACCEKLKDFFDSAMSRGQVESAMGCALLYTINGFQAGYKLKRLADDIKTFSEKAETYNFKLYDQLIGMYLQAALNLMGECKEPTTLNGEATTELKLLKMSEKNDTLLLSQFYYMRMFLAYIFQQYDLAAEMSRHRQDACKLRPHRHATIVNETLYSGLIAAALAGQNSAGAAGWRKLAEDAMEKMQAWSLHSEWNFRHKLLLLNAELESLSGDLDKAARTYDEAISVATKHGFIHEQAIACERAGLFFSERMRNTERAKQYFARSYTYYIGWGASRKASDLLDYF